MIVTILRLVIVRMYSGDEGTFGDAIFGETQYNSLEPPSNLTERYCCIAAGSYPAYIENDKRLGIKAYTLHNVPGHVDSIRILPGMWAGDLGKGLYNDMLGYIALGRGIGDYEPPEMGFKRQRALL